MVLGEEQLDSVRVSNELILGFLLHDVRMIPLRGQHNVIKVHLTPQECFNNTTIVHRILDRQLHGS